MNMGIANQFVITGLSLDHGSLDWGPGVVIREIWADFDLN